MAKDLLDKTGLTYLSTKFQEWCESLFVKKDTEYKDVYASDRGVKVSIGGTIGSPIISVETTVGEISENNSSVVSGDMVKAYVDANKGVNTVFQAQTSSSNAVNGLVPAPTSANTQKYLRGDGTWSTYGIATSSSSGLMSSEMASLIHPNLWSGAKGLGDNTHENLLYIYGKGSTCYFISDKKNDAGSDLVYTMINDGNIGNYKVGSATVADKLGTGVVGSTKKPIYLNNGAATPIDYTIEKSVPSDAVFTDTHYTAKNIVSNSAGAIETAAAANGEVHINLVENDTWRSGINITGSGATLVTSDAYGNITITSDDTTYGLATTSHNGLMSSEQVKMVSNSVQKGDNIDLSNGKALLFGQATSETWEYENGAGIKMLQAIGSTPKNAPSAYSVGLLVSGYYGFILARKVGAQVESLQYRGTSTNGWETVITDKNIESYTTSYAKTTDITEGNITAAKATTADSANAIGGKSVDDLVQGGGMIKYIKVVTALPANPSNDTLYLIKQ